MIGTDGAPASAEGAPDGGGEWGGEWAGRWAPFVLGVGVTAAVILIAHLGRGTTFFYDDWDFVLRRHSWSSDSLFRAHNGHPSVFPAAAYLSLFDLVGTDDYAPYRAMPIALHAIDVVLLYLLTARRVGRSGAVCIALVLAFLGSAWDNFLWAFQVGFLLSMTGGLLALLMIENKRRWASAAGCAGLVVAVLSSGVGVPFVAAVGIETVVARRWRQLWVPAIPTVVYGVWYLSNGQAEARLANARHAPLFVLRAAGGAMAALGGMAQEVGLLLLGGLGAALVVAVVRRRAVPPRVAGVAVAGVLYWTLLALARPDGYPASSRYTHLGAVLLLLVLAEVIGRRVERPPAVLVMAVLAAGCVWGNLAPFRAGGASLRATSEVVLTELAVLEDNAAIVTDDYRPDTQRAPQLTAGEYLRVVRTTGSPADDTRIGAQGRVARAEADRVLSEITAIRLEAAGPLICPTSTTTGGVLRARDDLVITAGETPVEVRVRRHALDFDRPPIGVVSPHTRSRLIVPTASPSSPWYVAVPGAAEVQVCA